MAEDWVTTTEAVQLTGYNQEYIRRILRTGKIKGRKWGRDWMIDRDSLIEYMRDGKRRGPRSSHHRNNNMVK